MFREFQFIYVAITFEIQSTTGAIQSRVVGEHRTVEKFQLKFYDNIQESTRNDCKVLPEKRNNGG